jgi:hypothetical protein
MSTSVNIRYTTTSDHGGREEPLPPIRAVRIPEPLAVPSQIIQDLEVLLETCANLSYDIVSIISPFVRFDGAVRGSTQRNLK